MTGRHTPLILVSPLESHRSTGSTGVLLVLSVLVEQGQPPYTGHRAPELGWKPGGSIVSSGMMKRSDGLIAYHRRGCGRHPQRQRSRCGRSVWWIIAAVLDTGTTRTLLCCRVSSVVDLTAEPPAACNFYRRSRRISRVRQSSS
jgi:hypothetical protein